jgi:ribosomal protein S8
MKIIDNVIPVKGEASPFFNCLSSLVFTVQKETYVPKNNSKAQEKATSDKRTKFSSSVLTASGLALSFIFNTKYDDKFDKTQYYKALGNDDYIKYSLNFARCNYRIINSGDDEMQTEIEKSINNNIPILAEGLSDSSWCLITGYDNGKLYGYNAGCPYCQDCINCVNKKVDGYIENGMFYIMKQPKRIIIIDNFNAEPYDDKTFLNYWISVMEHTPKNGFLFGNDAYDAVIKLLEDDDMFLEMDDDRFKNLYRQIYINSFLPEYRFCQRWMEFVVNLPDRTKKAEYSGFFNGFAKHDIGYKFWAALSDKGEWKVNTQKYAVMLKEKNNRKNAIKELKKLKKEDALTLNNIKSIL